MGNSSEKSTSTNNRRDLLKTGLLLVGGALLPTPCTGAAPASAACLGSARNRVSTRRKLGTLEVFSMGLSMQNMSCRYTTEVPNRAEIPNVIRTAHDHGITLFDAAGAVRFTTGKLRQCSAEPANPQVIGEWLTQMLLECSGVEAAPSV